MIESQNSRASRSVCAALLLVAACTDELPPPASPAEMESRGPRVVWTTDDIEAVRSRLEVEPWRSAWLVVRAQAQHALEAAPPAVVDNGGGHAWRTERPYSTDGVYRADADRHDYLQAIAASQASQALSIAWQLERDARYADRALAWIDRFCIDPATRYDARPSDNSIEILITMPGIVFAADLIWDHPGWAEAQRAGFVAFCRELVASFSERDDWHNNWDGWRIALLMTIGVFLDDRPLMTDTAAHFRTCVEEQVSADGTLPAEIARTRSLRYTSMALSALLQAGVIGERRGLALLDYVGADGAGLRSALDRLAPAVIDPASWPHDEMESEIGPDYVFAGLWEIAVAQWNAPAHRRVIEHLGRPLDSMQGVRFATLLFADRGGPAISESDDR